MGVGLGFRLLNPSPERPSHAEPTIISAEMVAWLAGAPQLPQPARSILVSAPSPICEVGSIVLKLSCAPA